VSWIRKTLAVILATVVLALPAWAFDPFEIKDIRVEGLQRISAGTVFSYLPVKIGDQITQSRSPEIVRALFKTGFFKDVRLERDGEVLVIFVQERPAIASIDINGNQSLENEQLLGGLKDIGFATGRVFDRSILDKVEQELQRLYFSQGKYGVKIKSTVTPLARNRIGVSIDVSEGVVAKIHQINIVGNRAFDDEALLDEFELSTPTLLSFYTGVDRYSRQKLAADLERLRSFYQNRGYIAFNIDSTQVSITPDKKDVFITINVTEGDRYTVSKIKLAGNLVVDNKALFKLVDIKPNSVFSRRKSTAVSDRITKRLGNDGYSFANVNVVPDVNEKDKTVDLTFFIDPGKRAYVRRINFTGNTRTKDEVLRREMRQFEGGWISTARVERSRQRLQRLGYFDEVSVETPAVPGKTDQVDVNFKVKERPSGNLLAGLGFSDSEGVVFNTSVTQDNFLGSGKRISVAFNTSSVNTLYRLSYTNPYYTLDGVSRTFNVQYREVDADEADISNFSSNISNAGFSFGIPISEFNSIGLDLQLQRTDITTGVETPQAFRNFLRDNGEEFIDLVISGSISSDTRNNSIFPTRGGSKRLFGEVTVPGSDLEYYKISYRQSEYFAVTRDLTLGISGEIGYGDSYGSTTDLPFFENFLAGGDGSVRGFENNTLGPKDEFEEALGGSLLTVGTVELIFPVPFVKDKNAFRLSSFFDVGNVYGTNEDFSFDELRYSVGLGLTWLSPFGALTVSIAQPFNVQDDDETKNFQFRFGQGFQ